MLVEHAADAILVLADGEVIYASPATSQVLGRPVGALQGFPRGEFVHADDLPLAVDLVEQVRAAGDGEPISKRLRVIHADGSVRFLEAAKAATARSARKGTRSCASPRRTESNRATSASR